MQTLHPIRHFTDPVQTCPGGQITAGTKARRDAPLAGGTRAIWLREAPSYARSCDAFLASPLPEPASCSAISSGQDSRAFLRLDAPGALDSHADVIGSAAPSGSALEEAKQTCRARSRLLAAASHDLRQPLQTIGLWVELLQEQVQDGEVRSILRKIHETSRGAERVLNALLDLTKLDLDVIGVDVTEFAVADLLEHVATTFGPLAREHHLALRVRKSSAIARSDPILLERILFNFVGNAIRHSVRGGVLVGCRQHEAFLSFEVWDTGLGIPQDRLADIFEEFVQLDSANGNRRHGGVGLGLSIAKRAAGLLGHPIQVSSRSGKGSCFRVDVACGEQRRMASTSLDSHESDAAIFGAFVVIVEDETEQREAMRLLLRKWGCQVVATASGAEAIEQLADHMRLPNVVLADCKLPNNETGLGAIRAIRSATAEDVPAFIMTGEGSTLVDANVGEPGIAMLRKPVVPKQLRKRLAEALINGASRLACPQSPTAPARIPGPAGAQPRSPAYAS